jgi:hypothetical protein
MPVPIRCRARQQPAIADMRTIPLRLREPSSLMLVAGNALPIVGILFWGWDAFQLLILYWLETAILGFWAMTVMAISPVKALGPAGKQKPRVGIIAFLLLHSGIFMGVHFMMLWELFAGGWRARIHSVSDFFSQIVIGQGLWLPLLVLFLMRGLVVLLMVLEPKWIYGRKPRPLLAPPDDDGPFPINGPIFGFYIRIIIMQFALLLGGFIAAFIGAGAPLILLVIIKTAIDLGFFLNMDERVAASVANRSTVP